MIDTFVFTVPELLVIVRKGRGMTLWEKADLDTNLAILGGERVLVNGADVSDADTLAFLRDVLPVAIKKDVPKMADMMRLFGLEMDTVFTFNTRPFRAALKLMPKTGWTGR